MYARAARTSKDVSMEEGGEHDNARISSVPKQRKVKTLEAKVHRHIPWKDAAQGSVGQSPGRRGRQRRCEYRLRDAECVKTKLVNQGKRGLEVVDGGSLELTRLP